MAVIGEVTAVTVVIGAVTVAEEIFNSSQFQEWKDVCWNYLSLCN